MRQGSIIATIITAHMPRNDAVELSQVCPPILIHTIDMVQPPGIAISPIADIDAHQRSVVVQLAAQSRAATPKKARCEGCSEFMTIRTLLIGCRTRHGGATKRHPRYALWAHGPARDTYPRARRVRGHRWNLSLI